MYCNKLCFYIFIDGGNADEAECGTTNIQSECKLKTTRSSGVWAETWDGSTIIQSSPEPKFSEAKI
jgi:hypothetical protein